MKKLSVVILFVLLTSAVFVACGRPTPEATQPSPAATEAPPAATEAPPAATEAAAPVSIDVWYVPLSNWPESLEQLVPLFQKQNPDVTVNLAPIPYEDFDTKLAASIPVGEGPDVMGPYYGAIPLYVKSGLVAPIPEDVITTDELNATLVDAAQAMVFNGKYYAVPYYIMNYAVFYNKDLFAKAGIAEPPKTWEELREKAIKCAQHDENGKLTIAGYYQLFSQQDHIIFMQNLENFGQPPFSEDWHKTLWNASETGYNAFEWFINLTVKDKVSEPAFWESAYGAFTTGNACMIIAGPQVIGQVKSENPTLNWGTAPMVTGPATDQKLATANTAQYWTFAISSQAAKDPAKYNASGRFIKFLLSEEAVRIVTGLTGALPQIKSLMNDPLYTQDEYLKAFIETLPRSYTLFWANVYTERQVQIDMADMVFLKGKTPREALDWATAEDQKIRDDYFAQ